MDTIEQYVRSLESRIIGRVFTHEDRLHFVLDADRETGLARLSCRYAQHTEFLYMPVAEVVLRLEQECRKHAQSFGEDLGEDLDEGPDESLDEDLGTGDPVD